jgi:hypothetical protein
LYLALLTQLQAQEIVTGDTYSKAIERVKASITRYSRLSAGAKYYRIEQIHAIRRGVAAGIFPLEILTSHEQQYQIEYAKLTRQFPPELLPELQKAHFRWGGTR